MPRLDMPISVSYTHLDVYKRQELFNMKKGFHAKEFDGMTFGMEVETGTKAYENFKKSVKDETAYSIFGDPLQVLTLSLIHI